MRTGLSQRLLLVIGLFFVAGLAVAWFRTGPAAAQQAGSPKPPIGPTAGAAPERAKPVAAPPAPIRPAGHGWFTRQTVEGTVLLHLPPRDAAATPTPGIGGTARAAAAKTEGTLRLAPGVTDVVERIAWWQGRVYLAQRPAPVNATKSGSGQMTLRRQVSVLSAVRSPSGWEYSPGQPESIAGLPGRPTDLVAFGACRLGPVALLRHGSGSKWLVPRPTRIDDAAATPRAGDLELVIFGGTTGGSRDLGAPWRRLELPWSMPTPSESDTPPGGTRRNDSYWIEGSGDELICFVADSARTVARMYSTKLPASLSADQRIVGLAWSVVQLPLVEQAGSAQVSIPSPDFIGRIDSALIATAYSPADNELRLFWLRPNQPAEEVTSVLNIPHMPDVIPMDGSGRLSVVWNSPVAKPAEGESGGASGDSSPIPPPAIGGGGGHNQTGLEICEISTTTGKVLYAGPLKTDYWISLPEFRILAFMLVLVMAAVIIFVLRTEPSGLPALPKGVALAEPGRRYLATVFDFIPAALLVEAIMSLPTGTLLLPSQVTGEQFSIWAMFAALGLAAAHSTLGEWTVGRSIGKLMTGCAVASVRQRRSPAGPAAVPPVPAPAESDVAKSELHLSRPALWQCLIRNLVKWAVPILGMFILFDPSRRHPGDLLAKTLVLRAEVDAAP